MVVARSLQRTQMPGVFDPGPFHTATELPPDTRPWSPDESAKTACRAQSSFEEC